MRGQDPPPDRYQFPKSFQLPKPALVVELKDIDTTAMESTFFVKKVEYRETEEEKGRVSRLLEIQLEAKADVDTTHLRYKIGYFDNKHLRFSFPVILDGFPLEKGESITAIV